MLNHTAITAPDARPERYFLFLHGLLGTAANWRSFARRWVAAFPVWGALIVDLRMHGQSQGFGGPHTVDAAADDLVALEPHLPGPVNAVLGHSLGGKIALAYSLRRAKPLTHLLVLDSNPGPRARDDGTDLPMKVLGLLETLSFPFRTQQAFWTEVESHGISPGVARWLGMNLVHRSDGYHFGPDLSAMHALVHDYSQSDCWRAVDPPPAQTRVGFLLGGRSNVCDAATAQRLARIASLAPDRFRVETLPNAGHWVHVDAPEATFRFVTGVIGL